MRERFDKFRTTDADQWRRACLHDGNDTGHNRDSCEAEATPEAQATAHYHREAASDDHRAAPHELRPELLGRVPRSQRVGLRLRGWLRQ